jgi:hypothetical protein
MPGFQIDAYGGLNNDSPTNVYETRRKHRWFFETLGRNPQGGGSGELPAKFLLVLKEASRPAFTAEEPDMHHNQEVVYFAGKHKWEPCKLIWYDVEQEPNSSKEAWDWLMGVVDITKGKNLPVYHPRDYKKDAKLQMINGRGTQNELWHMYGCWPKDVNWQSLDYAATEILQIEVSMRFDRARRDPS